MLSEGASGSGFITSAIGGNQAIVVRGVTLAISLHLSRFEFGCLLCHLCLTFELLSSKVGRVLILGFNKELSAPIAAASNSPPMPK